MIKKDDKDISAIYLGRKVISAIYKGSRLVWQAVRSCFGSGMWIGEKPWLNEEIWKS